MPSCSTRAIAPPRAPSSGSGGWTDRRVRRQPQAGEGLLDLVDAWPAVAAAAPARQLAIVGGGPLHDAVTAKLVGTPGVRLVGAEPLAGMPTWMAAAMLVLPSHVEGTPNVVLEALARGRRVVATAVGGVPDLLTRPCSACSCRRAPRTASRRPRERAAQAVRSGRGRRLGSRGGWAASARRCTRCSRRPWREPPRAVARLVHGGGVDPQDPAGREMSRIVRACATGRCRMLVLAAVVTGRSRG